MQLARPSPCQWALPRHALILVALILQLRLKGDMEYMQEEMEKTRRLQAEEEQRLAAWQAGFRMP